MKLKFKDDIEHHLLDIYRTIGIDKPENHEKIKKFVARDVKETSDPYNWHSGDVAIAFRRWMEHKK